MDLYKYRRRLDTDSAMNSIENNTKDIVNYTFHESPNFKKVFLNGYEVESRVNLEDDSNEKSIQFRPDTEVNKGDVIEINGTHWLTVKVYDNSIYPTAYVQLCNEWLKWIDETGQTLIYPASIQNKDKRFNLNEDEYVTIAEDMLTLLTPYNKDTQKIKPLQRFIIGDIPYEVHGIDAISNVALGKGYIELKAQHSLIEHNDNFEDDIANNDGSGWGAW
jgi:hypothetical protein